ncbi:arsenite methyltransferase [Magnetovibrio sp.]|uniref:arsenite methyltransferase n=1 Tax=Magnetovibrio sp. TaxID=2024836 RepID=UPI002F926666
MSDTNHHDVRKTVRESYATIATQGGNSGCCAPTADGGGCCGPSDDVEIPSAEQMSAFFGYSSEEMAAVPEGANLGLGCGNPQAIADMTAGEVVIDLGAGAGFDAFLAAGKVGPNGHVIGIDMTHEMLAKARANAEKGGYKNVEFRLGEIEYMPVADDTADVIISNCVINLSPNKPQVLREAFRVLKPGGRLAISDVVATAPFPDDFRDDDHLLSGCVTGASMVDDLQTWLEDAGFERVLIDIKEESRAGIADWAPGRGVEKYVVSAIITATKPGGGCGSQSGCC